MREVVKTSFVAGYRAATKVALQKITELLEELETQEEIRREKFLKEIDEAGGEPLLGLTIAKRGNA